MTRRSRSHPGIPLKLSKIAASARAGRSGRCTYGSVAGSPQARGGKPLACRRADSRTRRSTRKV